MVIPRSFGQRPYVVRAIPTRLAESAGEAALRVLDGTGLVPIAEELSISVSTVRTHLKHVFEKTDTHRQAELVRLLLRGLAARRQRDPAAGQPRLRTRSEGDDDVELPGATPAVHVPRGGVVPR